ncbi:GNAT family N-acetyltransferase [Candidatus Babeliales bacterium]|nr:GNAT family N-acetyltransferase [Candidatus Babeliales bacterium]
MNLRYVTLLVFSIFSFQTKELECLSKKFDTRILSTSSMDDVVGLCSCWIQNQQEVFGYGIEVSYEKALMLLIYSALDNHESYMQNAFDFEQFWQLVYQRVYDAMSYKNRLYYYMTRQMGMFYADQLVTKAFFKEITASNTSGKEDNKSKNLFLITSVDGKPDRVVASALCRVVDQEIIEVKGLMVQKEYRKKGIASSLLQQIETYAKNNAIPEIEFEVYSSNHAMLHCAAKFGYEQYDVRDDLEDIYERPISIYYFKKTV